MSAIREYRTLLRQDLYSFFHRVFLTINPGVIFMPNWHLQVIAYQLTLVAEGHIRRLIITLPLRSGKSISASVALPYKPTCWVFIPEPRWAHTCLPHSISSALPRWRVAFSNGIGSKPMTRLRAE